MNNKEFITQLSDSLGTQSKDTQKIVNELVAALADTLVEGKTVNIQGFGYFEPKTRKEKILVNPTTKQRMLIPPKLTVSFKPSNLLKEKLR